MDYLERKNGITLISLVIMIIVLIILAGVSTAMLIGENSIIRQATKAKEETEIANEKERIELAIASAILNSSDNKLTTEKLQEELQNEFKEEFGILSGEDGWNYVGENETFHISNNGEVSIILNYKIYGNNSQLPNEYQQVEYIESTRTQIMDLGYIPKRNTQIQTYISFEGDFQPIVTEQKTTVFLGVSDGVDTTFSVNFGRGSNQYDQIFNWVTTHGGPTSSTTIYVITNKLYNQKQQYILGNGIAKWGKASVSLINKPNDNIKTLALFGQNRSDFGLVPFVAYDMKIYDYFKIYEGNELVRNYIPCYKIENTEPGLYDTITNNFYTNQGSGEFLRGNDVNVSVGNKNSDNNKYDIPLKITTSTGEVSCTISLEAPLRKVGDIVDYIDLKNKTVTRFILEDGTIATNPSEESIEIDNNLPDIKDILSIEVRTDVPPSKIEACE